MNEIIFVDKRSGITSFDVIRELRKKLGIRKMGHAGTLDPLATGLMIIATGEKTKELSQFLKLPKTYTSGIRFGIRTDTGDISGVVVEEKPTPAISNHVIDSVLQNMKGDILLPVPLYSAIKKQGRPLYDYARNDEKVEVPIKTMHIDDAYCIHAEGDEATVFFSVSSGTYIRSLIEELGRRLNTVATMTSLRRNTIGNYSVDDRAVISV